MPTFAILLAAFASNALFFEKTTIPAEAKTVIQHVHKAAMMKDFASLRKLMVSEFTWSFGGDGDANQALDAWKHDSRSLRELARVTGLRCSFRAVDTIQCPPNAGYHYRAGFKKTEEGWRMEYFVAGD